MTDERLITHVWCHDTVSPEELDTMEKDEQWDQVNPKDTRNAVGFAEVRKVYQVLHADPENKISGQPSNNMKNKLAKLMRKIYAIDIDTRQELLPDFFDQDGAQRGGPGGDSKAKFFVARKKKKKEKRSSKKRKSPSTDTGTSNSPLSKKRKKRQSKSGDKKKKKKDKMHDTPKDASSSDASSSSEDEESVSKPSFSQKISKLQDFEEEEESEDDEESVRDLQDQVAELMEVATNFKQKLKIIRKLSKKIIQVIDAERDE